MRVRLRPIETCYVAAFVDGLRLITEKEIEGGKRVSDCDWSALTDYVQMKGEQIAIASGITPSQRTDAQRAAEGSYRERNRDAVRARKARYYRRRREDILARRRASYRTINGDLIRARSLAWYNANRDRVLQKKPWRKYRRPLQVAQGQQQRELL